VPELRYNANTTEAAKSLAKIFGAFPGVREAAADQRSGINGFATALTTPVLIENYVSSMTGGLGRYALQLASEGMKQAGVVNPPEKPLATLAEMPVIRAFTLRYPNATAQSIQDFYDRNEQAKKVMDSIATKAREGDVASVQWTVDNYRPRVVLDDIQKTLGQHALMVRQINESRTMSPLEKRQLIDTIYANMIQLAKGGNKMLDEAEKTTRALGAR
jgi:hypothetical protein